MKSILIKIKVLAVCLSFGYLTSCTDYLNVSDELAGGISDISQVFENVDRTKKWYSDIFASMPVSSAVWQSSNPMGNSWTAYTDEVYTRLANNDGKYTNWSSSNTVSQRWGVLYERIRQANIFLEMARPITEEGGTSAARLLESEVERYKANVRFMRAAYHYYLMELYGPIPIVDRSFTLNDDLDLPRRPLDEVIDFIDREILEAIPGMEQEPYHDTESYRAVPTKGAALALRAKLWVQAASKLLNGGFTEALSLTNKDGERLFPDENTSKLDSAVKACKNLIDYAEQGNRYELYKVMKAAPNNTQIDADKSVYELFQEYNKEMIWANSATGWGTLETHDFDKYATPRSEPLGLGNINLLQELIDDFYMDDGFPIKQTSFLDKSPNYTEVGLDTWNGVEEVSNMYIHREPRFYNTVCFSGMKWPVSNKEVQFFYDGNADKKNPDGHPPLGYLLYKRYNRTIHGTAAGAPKSKYRPSIIFRLAEFYLLYAEMLNEVNPAHTDVLKYVNLVRERAGLPNLQVLNPAIAGNQNLQREAIRRESRIELATEGQRYFDVRRWMIAENAHGEGGQGGDFYGMNDDGNRITFHTRRRFHTRHFSRKNYLYPIPLDEIRKSKVLVQNPGW
ncbi:MAG: RagB/SusD family nutrient uptake outer membrane protein [Dysgonamonadaceae bacterium]|jgi:hypothetical protein|nr:RagB/SusD family nutrient uptake outer membrane protein [Dysgonamonadaceae bacterium]